VPSGSKRVFAPKVAKVANISATPLLSQPLVFLYMEYYQVEAEVVAKIEAVYLHYQGLGFITEREGEASC
jgi:hypothetical protein